MAGGHPSESSSEPPSFPGNRPTETAGPWGPESRLPERPGGLGKFQGRSFVPYRLVTSPHVAANTKEENLVPSLTSKPPTGESMDRLDIRILRELTQGHTFWPARPGLRSSYREIARRLGVSPGTVRNRLGDMFRNGFLQGIVLFPNASLLGLTSGAYAIEVRSADPRETVIERISAIPGVVFFENFRGSLLGLGLVYPNARALDRLLARIDQAAESDRGFFTPAPHPPCTVTPTPWEWSLVARLIQGPPATHSQLAREVGSSVRTVKRHIHRLVDAGALLTFPRMDYRALRGGVTAELLVVPDPAANRAEMRRHILAVADDWTIYAGGWDLFEIYRLILPNVPLANELADRIRTLPGVGSVRMEFVDGLIDRFGSFREYVAHAEAQARSTRSTVRVS